MKNILEIMLKQGQAGEFQVLLESQLSNCNSEINVRRRRWDPNIISLCLNILLRSPKAYRELKETGLLVLPTERLLKYYKNMVKQKPGFNADNLDWMKKEAERKKICDFGLHGRLLIDEMTIQDDLVITKKGDNWDIIGMVDMGDTNNTIREVINGSKEVEMATHILQFIFHGFTGFR